MPDQIIQPSRTNEPDMPPAVSIDIEDMPLRFVGVIDEFIGRDKAPRIIGVGQGTLENIRRGRRKSVGIGLFHKLQGAVIRVLAAKIRHLEAERQLALQCGARISDERLIAAAASLVQLEKLIKGTVE